MVEQQRVEVPAPSVVVVGEGFEALGRLPMLGRQRVSDHFNEHRAMLILEGAEIEGSERFDADADELAINRAAILLVVPVEETYTTDRAEARAAMKERHRVRLMVGKWVVEGDVHVTPEVSVERFINMGHSEFLPLTSAVLSNAESDRNETLVLVSRARISLLRPLAVVGADEPASLLTHG